MHPPAATAWRRNVTRKPTLKTIAEISGLAVATVSRALNDAPDIRADTKVLVRRIAADIGYVPNRAGVRLRTGRTNVISLILATESDVMDNTSKLISAIAGTLRDTPYHLIVTPYFPDQDPMEPVRYMVETGSADAIILNQTQPDDPRVKYLIEKGFPFATHGRTSLGVEHAYFDYDNAAYGKIVVRRLVQRGCKSIVMLAPPLWQSYSRHMSDAARAESARLGVAFQVENCATADDPNDRVRACVAERLRTNPEVDGYICASAQSAMATVAGVEDVGRSVGTDIQVAAKEAVPLLNLFRKEIIVLPEDVSRAGV
ncbi:MAG: LacI family transcriptional regulator, partial [Maritimibacter sp.]